MYQGSWWTATGHDRYQNEALESLAWTVSRHSRTFNQQLSDARKANQRLSSDLAGLSERLESFMEYVDLRFDLLRFDHELSVHNAIDRRFAALASGASAVTADIADIEGYWLPPAALDLLARLEGSEVDPAWTRTAERRDAVRARLFRLSAGHGFERSELTIEPALALLAERPSLLTHDSAGETPVAAAWRSLWLTTADGRHGPEASRLLLERLMEFRSEPTTQQWRELLDSGPRRSPGTTLRALRETCQSILDPAVRKESTEIDAWRSYMEEMAGEGSAAARSVLARVRQHRDRLDGRPPGEYPAWRRPVGDAPELLMGDLRDPDAPSAARVFALRVLAPSLRAACAELYELSRRPATMTREFRTHGRTVVVTRDGISARDRVAHEQYLASRYPTAGRGWIWSGAATVALVVLGIVLVSAGPTIGIGLFVLIGAGVGVVMTLDRVRSAREGGVDHRAAVESLHMQIERAQRQITHEAHKHVQQQAEARSDHDAVMAALDRVEALPVT